MPIPGFDFINVQIISQKALFFVRIEFLLIFLMQNRILLIDMIK